MMRIVALNQVRNEAETEENEDGIQVTKEAEETIAVSEYMRALSFKQKGRDADAQTLFSELLETRVLNEISFDDKNDKLVSVRYNCHKNLALIYEEKGEKEKALEHFMEAMNLDDTDVYTLNRLGQLALEVKRMNLAEFAFDKCLVQNPNHWPAGDGILQVMCHNENILGAYGWALKWYKKNPKYERAIDVLNEITDKFDHMLPFFKSVWKELYTMPSDASKLKKRSVFPEADIVEDKVEHMVTPNLDDFKVEELHWLTIGKFITSLYNHLMETKQLIIFIITVDDMLQEKVKEKSENGHVEDETDVEMRIEIGVADTAPTDSTENTNDDSTIFIAPISEPPSGQTSQPDSNAEDSDNPNKETESAKPTKPRRRCSDLSFLEQWGWHKNRRYSSRKKSQQDRPEIDTSINGFLRRILPKYFQKNFDDESPFLADVKIDAETTLKSEKPAEETKRIQLSYELFRSQTEDDFQEFLKELKAKNFDLIALIFVWLKYVSKYWDQPITEDMKELYHEIFQFYLNHYDTQTWNQLSNDDFNASFRMMLFFMELDHEKEFVKSRGQVRNEIDPRWKMLYHHLMFHSGFAYVLADDLYEKNIIRLIWLDYCSAKFENDLHRSVECLLHLEHLLEKQESTFKLEYPNLKDHICVDLEIIRITRVNLQRRISLNNVKNLYDSQDFESLIEILKDSMVNSIEIKNSDNTLMKIQTQIEVLIESFWNVGRFKECLIWSERSLKYAVDNLLNAPTDTYRYREWADSVNFILIYIEELVLKKGYDILTSLEKYQSRLVQSLAKVLAHQLDTPFDKNNNPYHPVHIKQPWIILQQILQRNEDNSPVVIKVRNPDILPENEDIEELIPHTLLILFTAHESLGRRQWCTRDNGQLLHYALDVIVPKLRAPFMDAYRDYVFEYLEQITYCLYGYPPKKPRSRHIEEHDASPVKLTWKRAITLFDIYRPETLPEFNSYKGDSISADMEQLLLKILSLIPKEIDPNTATGPIRDFIGGKTHDLPKRCDLMPWRISCVFYLLADYYFKSRDFSKTLKFYVLDLACEPTRFDSWAGLALSKASKLETKLNSCTHLEVQEFLNHSENAQRCFEQCIKLNPDHTLFWIEYGSFAYTIHSFCSRNIKQSSDTLSMEMFAFVEARKEEYLNSAYQCFTTAEKIMHQPKDEASHEDTDSHDEKWLHHYMLGKIAEKRKEHPKVYLDHYIQAAKYLYENNAAYPFKINHNNPSTLSIEALEVFYRTTSSIIKYLEQHSQVSREIGRLFTQTLKDLASSPFACNQAKIDNSSILLHKRKLAEKVENSAKHAKLETSETSPSLVIVKSASECVKPAVAALVEQKTTPSENADATKEKEKAASTSAHSGEGQKIEKSQSQTPNEAVESKTESPSRRGSQRAFDSVPHSIILRALNRVGLDDFTKQLLKSNMETATTKIQLKGKTVAEINIKKGLKQGDPLSPVIFNIVMDEYVRHIKGISPHQIPVMLYADDIIILADSVAEGKLLVQSTETFMEERGLKINVDKCFAIAAATVPCKEKVYYITTPTFTIYQTPIKQIQVGEGFKYLGVNYEYSGLARNQIYSLDLAITRVMKAALTPAQRLHAIEKRVIPAFIPKFVAVNMTRRILRKADLLIRRAVRKTLHLPVSCNNAGIHAAKKDGGLGIFEFSQRIPLILLRKMEFLDNTTSPLKELANSESTWRTRIRSMTTFNSTLEAKRNLASSLEQSFSGNGIYHSAFSRHCSDWINHPPKYWKGWEFNKAIHLRLNMLPCRSMPTTPANLRRCRAGCFKAESISHILQSCPMTHWQRIHRHNAVAKLIANTSRRSNWQVAEEPHIRTASGELFKPDIIISNHREVIVTDVGIHWEGPTPLIENYRAKAAKYSAPAILDVIRNQHPDKDIYVLPLIVGTWCRANDHLVHRLKMTDNTIRRIILTTLSGGIYTHQYFMRVV